MKTKISLVIIFLSASIVFLGSWYLITSGNNLGKEDIAPEFTFERVEKEAVVSNIGMVSTANPYASKAAMSVLCEGGNALDAAIAAQMVLNLVEPQSSGIGGGGFLLYYDKNLGRVFAYDGRETAPCEEDPACFLDQKGNPMSLFQVYTGGLSVGVPGLLRMLETAHERHGRRSWKELFQPAIHLADNGFPISARMHAHLSNNPRLKQMEASRNLFFDESGQKVKAIGELLKNPQLAETFRLIANQGADPFYTGSIAEDIVQAVERSHINPGKMSLEDLKNYQAFERKPVSIEYKDYLIVGFPPPSSGGVTILQILGILENLNLTEHPLDSVEAIHLIAEASNLAFADRNKYLADPDFVAVPVSGMLDKKYLWERSQLISKHRVMDRVAAGELPLEEKQKSRVKYVEVPSTTHISIVDREGNAVSMTTSIEQAFGSGLLVRGFLLNNQMTDFSFEQPPEGGTHRNQLEAGKRPRSSMAPTLVFDKQTGELVFVIGSPGGARIISYVVKALIGVLDYGLDTQEAITFPNFSSRNGLLELEQKTRFVELAAPLRRLGHQVKIVDLNSGSHGIQVLNDQLIGGADPRRESMAIGADWCGSDEN